MSSVGLVLGGGGITGASYHFGALFALQMATGWNATDADVIVGTSSGSFIAALVRGGALNLDTMVGRVSPRRRGRRLALRQRLPADPAARPDALGSSGNRPEYHPAGSRGGSWKPRHLLDRGARRLGREQPGTPCQRVAGTPDRHRRLRPREPDPGTVRHRGGTRGSAQGRRCGVERRAVRLRTGHDRRTYLRGRRGRLRHER